MLKLTRVDWDCIAHALSQYRHNPQYEVTYQKVIAILSKS